MGKCDHCDKEPTSIQEVQADNKRFLYDGMAVCLKQARASIEDEDSRYAQQVTGLTKKKGKKITGGSNTST